MSNYGDEEEEEIILAMERMSISTPDFTPEIFIFPEKLQLFGLAVGRYMSVSSLFTISGLFLLLAYFTEMHSFWNLLSLEISSGFLFFAVAYLGVPRRFPNAVRNLGGAVGISLLFLAYAGEPLLPGAAHHTIEFLRAALIEYAAALLLLAVLEVTIAPFLDSLREKQKAAREALEKAKKRFERENSLLSNPEATN